MLNASGDADDSSRGPFSHQPDASTRCSLSRRATSTPIHDGRWRGLSSRGSTEGDYGVAETLSTAKNTSVAGMVEAGDTAVRRGQSPPAPASASCPYDWVPDSDSRLIVWEAVHHLVRVHDKEGEDAAASLMSRLGPNAEAARELAYRLYRICDQKNRSQEALSYNALVQSWPEGRPAGPASCPSHAGKNGVAR